MTREIHWITMKNGNEYVLEDVAEDAEFLSGKSRTNGKSVTLTKSEISEHSKKELA